MKNLILFSFFSFAAFIFFSCKKSNEPAKSNSTPTISGRWSVVIDSTYDASNPAFDAYYIGLPADYYDFKPNGVFDWHEESVGSDSGSYLTDAANMVTISYFAKSDPHYSADSTSPFKIVTLTDHKLVLYTFVSGTVGTINQTITLSR